MRKQTPKGMRYVARWRTPEGRSREQWFDRKIDADRHLAAVTTAKASGAYVDAAAGRVKLREYAEAWAARQPHRGSTAQSVRSILDRHVLPTFGSRPLAAIRPSEVQAWVSGLKLAPSTVGVVYGKLAGILRSAVDDRLIAHSPCGRQIKLPRAHGGEVVPMEPREVRAIVDAAPAHYRALLVLIAGTGTRPGEALGLTSDRVDWLRRTIRVDRQLLTLSGQAPQFGPCKTPASVRTIPVPDGVLVELGRHVKRFEVVDDGELAGLLFRDEKGDPIRRNALGHMWRRAARKVNDAAAARDGVRIVDRTPHDLRHYCASVLIASGSSVKAVQKHLGHASATTTLDTYAHLWPDGEDATRAALAAGLDGVVNDDAPAFGTARATSF